MSTTTNNINQKSARAQGDIVAGSKTELHLHAAQTSSVVERLLAKLEDEMTNSAKVRDTIEALKRFYEKKAVDGVVGLEAKLIAGGRADEIYDALEKKEMFSKALEAWSLYASAQQIFVYLLAKAEHEFSMNIHPQVEALEVHEINLLVTERIVIPTVNECGASVFAMNHAMAMGMLYWLSEQCFVRWHK